MKDDIFGLPHLNIFMYKWKYLLFLFLIVLLIYGQKLFFYALPSDDYMRFYGDDNTNMLITNSARWAQALLNKYIFVGSMQILPYLHGLVGIFSFTLMGYLTAYYFERKSTVDIALVTLLVAISPMFAHNLYFSTNITTWLALLAGVIGILLVSSSSWIGKLIGTFLFIFSVGNYQTILQIAIVMVMVRIILKIINAKSKKEIVTSLKYAFLMIAFFGVSYSLSMQINQCFLHHLHLQETHRLMNANEELNVTLLWKHIIQIYQTFFSLHLIPLNYFQKILPILYAIMGGGSILGLYSGLFLDKNISLLLRVLKFFIYTLFFILLPLILYLPSVLDLDIPLRAHFTFDWCVAGFFVLQRETLKKFFSFIPILIGICILLISTYYIAIFFDAGYRQTQADIMRANTIVERIRQAPNYKNEPIKFYIHGQKKFNVIGWNMQWQQPFNSYWAKYKIFNYFTDFKFQRASGEDREKVREYLVKRNKLIHAYPEKDSVIVFDDVAILYLTVDDINNMIRKKEYLKTFPTREADVNGTFNLFLDEDKNMLYYRKLTCNISDRQADFFLRVYPNRKGSNLHDDNAPHTNLDFHFEDRGIIEGGSCLVAVPLPEYRIGRIRTGQFQRGVKIFWEENYYPGGAK